MTMPADIAILQDASRLYAQYSTADSLDDALRATCLTLAQTRAALALAMRYCEPTTGTGGDLAGCACPVWTWDAWTKLCKQG